MKSANHNDSASTSSIENSKKKKKDPYWKAASNHLVSSLFGSHSDSSSKRSPKVVRHKEAEEGDDCCAQQEDTSVQLDVRTKLWLTSFARSDPRSQIKDFFSNLSSQDDTINSMMHLEHVKHSDRVLQSSSVFTIWRPTSAIAIQRMMAGEATGKGLEIKGKSSKAGKLSGFVPYLQIHSDADKPKVKTLDRGGRTRIFYETREARDAVVAELEPLQNHILNTVHDAKRAVKRTAVSGIINPISRSIVSAKSHTAGLGKYLGADEVMRKSAMGANTVASSLRTLPLRHSRSDATTDSQESATSDEATTKSSGVGASLRKSMGRIIPEANAIVSGLRKSRLRRRCSNSSDDTTDSRDSIPENTIQRMSLRRKASTEDEREWGLRRLLWDMDDPSIRTVDDYAPRCYGIELPDRLLWKACVVDRDISRPEGSEYFTARPSQPAFQDMNFIAIQKTQKNKCRQNANASFSSGSSSSDDDPRVVLWQTCLKDDPMDPRGLIMAYEENGRVLPVVSDFDCFTMGTRGLQFESPLPAEQEELLEWCVTQIESVLDKQSDNSPSWTSCWLDVLKTSASKGFHPTMPRYGFGDPKSYGIMERAVCALKQNGPVRHGAECFNYFFPQELDAEFLIVCDTLPGVGWKYANVKELQSFLLQKIDEGFTFPLNPKWVLCDDGWKEIYDRLMSSNELNVPESLDLWFPPGVRKSIEAISERHPDGFVCDEPAEMTGTEAMDLATLDLDHFLASRHAKVKLRAVITFNSLLLRVRRRNAEQGGDDEQGGPAGTIS